MQVRNQRVIDTITGHRNDRAPVWQSLHIRSFVQAR